MFKQLIEGESFIGISKKWFEMFIEHNLHSKCTLPFIYIKQLIVPLRASWNSKCLKETAC
jgi:hypothetical protein